MLSIDKIKKKLIVFKKNQAILKVILFGSYAKGDESKKSDLDFAVIMDTKKRFFDRYDDCDEFYDTFNEAMDLLPYTQEEFDNISHRSFIQSIIKEGVVVYES
jgi:predicted nucleotidyltransferase